MTADTTPAESVVSSPQAIRVRVSNLKLTNFRSYARLAVAFDGRPVALSGANGAGKTNLMEAISFLSPGRGMRRAALDTVARHGGDGAWAVAAEVGRDDNSVAIGTGIAIGPSGPEKRRTIRIAQEPARGAEALLAWIKVIWLTPAMDGLFTGPASDRRQFVDRAVLAIDRGHATRVNAFEKALRGRNRLLSEPPWNDAYLEAIETEIASLGVAIAAARCQWRDLAAALIGHGGTGGPFPDAGIALSGFLEDRLGTGPAGDLEDLYRERLADERARDAAAGRTLTGPHRSDLKVRHLPKGADAETCSTGEQKALLIGLTLAQARLVTRLCGETPVVLLDEIAAHLDETRRVALFGLLDELGCQVFMTGTEGSVFAPFDDRAQHFFVADGALAEAPATAS